MPTYMVWETESRGGMARARPYDGDMPESAITLFCDDESTPRSELVTAAEAECIDGKYFIKPGGRSWTAQVEYEEVRTYRCVGLSEDDKPW